MIKLACNASVPFQYTYLLIFIELVWLTKLFSCGKRSLANLRVHFYHVVILQNVDFIDRVFNTQHDYMTNDACVRSHVGKKQLLTEHDGTWHC